MTGSQKKPAAARRAPSMGKGHLQAPRLIENERELAALCLALLGPRPTLSRLEKVLVKGLKPLAEPALVKRARDYILKGEDPLGGAFLRLRAPAVRRDMGAVYTPDLIVHSMLNWSAGEATPARIVDPGAGSGRYLLAAAKRFPKAQLVGVELDPLAALMLRASVKVLGLQKRTNIVVEDFRIATLPQVKGPTLFLGNPPYVRHHGIDEDWKQWFATSAKVYGVKASKLAGLHIHFFLRALQLAKPGDIGTFITSAEWLDVNYGATLRQLLSDRLGAVAVHVLDAQARPFEDAATTGAITCFKVGEPSEGLRVRAVETLETLNGLSKGDVIPWDRVRNATRWSPLFRPQKSIPEGHIELGELCRVHRGQVTGGNSVWIAGQHAVNLPPSLLVPTITKARDLLSAGEELSDSDVLRRVIDIPPDLDQLDQEGKKAVERFLKWARTQGADDSYIAKHRRAWWSVGLKAPAPILSTYMARRSPAFVRNLCGARHINIAHGIYPRQELPAATLDALAAWLRSNVVTDDGRTYAGGLTKFEPKELERVLIPSLDVLTA